MSLYADASVPVPKAITDCHQDEIASFSAPGGWMTGEERHAIVSYCRHVRAAAGLQVADTAEGETRPAALLPSGTLSLIELLATHPKDFTRKDYEAAVASGMSDEEYVELVGLVARASGIDVFARGIGASPRALLPPDAGEPDYYRPATAMNEGAWLPTVPSTLDGGEEALRLYGKNMMPFVYRALSLVPLEAARVIAMGNVQYLQLEHFFDFSYTPHPALTRAQVELVAGRVSAFNECFY